MICTQSSRFFTVRKRRRESMLQKMAEMRAAKERKRLNNQMPPIEPKMVPTTCLSIGFRDDISGTEEWVELKSARQARRLAGVMLKEYCQIYHSKLT